MEEVKEKIKKYLAPFAPKADILTFINFFEEADAEGQGLMLKALEDLYRAEMEDRNRLLKLKEILSQIPDEKNKNNL